MRGDDQQQFDVFSYVSLEERVPQEHPLRPIGKLVDEIFRAMGKDFDGLYRLSRYKRFSGSPKRELVELQFDVPRLACEFLGANFR